MTHNTHLECLSSGIFCCHSDALNTHDRQTLHILLPENVEWCDNYLYAIFPEQKRHPECEGFSWTSCCDGDNIFVVLEYSLNNTNLPKTWSVAKNFLSSALDLCERWNLLFWRLRHDFAGCSDRVEIFIRIYIRGASPVAHLFTYVFLQPSYEKVVMWSGIILLIY